MKVTNRDRIAWLSIRKPLWAALYQNNSNSLTRAAVVEDIFDEMLQHKLFTEAQRSGAIVLLPSLIHMAREELMHEESVA